MQTRSWESEVFIAFTHPAQSLVTGPAGQVVLNETAPDRRWSICDMDLTDANAARAAPMAHLRNRRPELYHP